MRIAYFPSAIGLDDGQPFWNWDIPGHGPFAPVTPEPNKASGFVNHLLSVNILIESVSARVRLVLT